MNAFWHSILYHFLTNWTKSEIGYFDKKDWTKIQYQKQNYYIFQFGEQNFNIDFPQNNLNSRMFTNLFHDQNILGVLHSLLNNRETWIIGMYRGTKIQEESFNDFLMASLFWYKSRWKPWFSADYIGNMQS